MIAVTAFLALLLLGETSQFTLLVLYLPRWPVLVVAIVMAALVPFAQRRVRVLLPIQVVFCLILLFPVAGFNVASSRHADKAIRLASYNIYFGKMGRPELIEEIADMPADIIVLQAANDSLGVRARERFPDRTVHQDHELMLISRLPVRAVEIPPPLADGTPSMFAKYVIETPQGTLRVYSVHPFSPRHAMLDGKEIRENLAYREAQIEAAVTAARNDVPPFVIIGDTNLPPMSSIGRRRLAGLKDAWQEVGFGLGYTFPAKRPWMRIDRALTGDRVRFLDFRIGKRGRSDHLPIYVDLEIIDQ